MDAGTDITEAVEVTPNRDGVGAVLRARRLELGLSYADVANAVKLPPSRINALEEERWDELPDGPYLRGFLRNIARALKLDASMLMERVDESLMRSRNPESILMPQGVAHAMLPRRSGPVDDRHGGRKLVYGAFVFALIAAVIAWSGTESFDQAITRGKALIGMAQSPSAVSSSTTEVIQAPKPVDLPVATMPVPAIDAAAPSSSSTTAPIVGSSSPVATVSSSTSASAPSALALLFHFNEESWVEVRSSDGKVLLQRLNAAGSEQEVAGEAPYSLIVGNAKGVALRFRGQPVDLAPYTHDQVARLTLS
jgi:cytoskeleton protein RodZ